MLYFVSKAIVIKSELACKEVSPLYSRILGWLDYKPAIFIIQSVINDSLRIKAYASYNKVELERNCELSLARMGDKKYEKETLRQLKQQDFNCNEQSFLDLLSDLFYINTQASINQVVDIAIEEKIISQPYMYGFVNECSTREVTLMYIAKVIKNYPIKWQYDERYIALQYPKLFVHEPFYMEQYPELLKWLKNNPKKYLLDRESFF